MRLPFLAILLTALALVPGGAHLASLPAKLALPAEAYLAAQAVYRGWSLWGVVQIGAILACLALGLRRGPARVPALAAAALMAAALGVFFAWTWPANQATANWTVLPPDWEALRAAWEWSHAGGAVLVLLALGFAIAAGLATLPGREGDPGWQARSRR